MRQKGLRVEYEDSDYQHVPPEELLKQMAASNTARQERERANAERVQTEDVQRQTPQFDSAGGGASTSGNNADWGTTRAAGSEGGETVRGTGGELSESIPG